MKQQILEIIKNKKKQLMEAHGKFSSNSIHEQIRGYEVLAGIEVLDEIVREIEGLSEGENGKKIV